MRPIFCLVVFMFLPALPAQNTWIVECTGRPGSHFRDLAPAVAAASSGDTIIMIASACLPRYTGAVIDKPLRVVGVSELGALGTAAPAIFEDRITVRNIPAGREVVLANLSLGPRSSGSTPHGLVVENCAGKVHLQRITYAPSPFANGALRFQDCADVSMHWCEFWTPDQPVTFRRANVTISDTTFNDSYPTDLFPPPWGIATTVENLLIDNSTVRLSDCVVWGADRRTVPGMGTFPARHAAVVLPGGTLMLGPGTNLFGGTSPPPIFNAAAIDNRGRVLMDRRSYHSGFLNVARTLDDGSEVMLDLHSVVMEPVIHNQPFRVVVAGPRNGFAVLAVASSMPQGISFPFGTLLLNPCDLLVLGSGALDGVGYRQWQFVPWGGLPLDRLYAFQAAYVAPGGGFGLTFPSVFTVTWEGGRMWP